jgi:4-hydroxy-4-methyl-2-oxoglutarate aldolase
MLTIAPAGFKLRAFRKEAHRMTLTIRREIPRPGADILKRFHGVPTGFVGDAMGRRGAIDQAIRPILDAPAFVGSALTVWTIPSDNLAPYAALGMARPGDVLVVAAENCESVAVVGDIMVGMAKNAGIVAVVTDGMVRDIDGLEQVGLPVYARGLTPNSPFKNGPGRIGLPVSVGGVVIESGDIVVGDRNGVVVVPRGRIDAVLKELEKVKAKEKDMDAAVAGGAKTPSWLPDYLAKNPPTVVD